jgi:tetratricopeptide (TPR) repeat protein
MSRRRSIVPIDRESTIRQAEKLSREGKLDLAIAEYVRLVDEQPHDWNSINALGDLYLRSGKVDRAVAQFIHIADHFFGEGFFPKAAAVYKKALKAKPDHEHAILRLADIAAAQELMADARAHLRRLWELRSERGDDQGAADCLIRLALLAEADIDTRLTGARAARLLGDTQRAVELFRSAAADLDQAGRGAEALDILAQVAELASDSGLRRELATRYLSAGRTEEAGRLLDPETVGSDPELMLVLASLELARRDDDAAGVSLTRFVGLVPDRFADVLRLAGELGRAGEPDRAFRCTAVVVDDAVLRGDWDRAIDVLQSFLVHGQHIPALVKLVHVAEGAGVEEVLNEAQERLVEAYLEQGQGLEAQPVAETLLARAPGSPVHAQRLRRAYQLQGAGDPDEAVRRALARLEPQVLIEETASEREPHVEPEVEQEPMLLVVDDRIVLSEPEVEVEPDRPERGPTPEPVRQVVDEPPPAARQAAPVEIDLSDVMAALGGQVAGASPSPVQAEEDDMTADLSDLEAVLNKMRPRGIDYDSVTEAASAYERGVQRIERDEVAQGLEDLKEAAYIPAFRFQAAARLGREYIRLGETLEGIEWLSRAAEMPAPTREAGLAVLYELARALESIGEGVRALAVLMEISADDAGYRDVTQRIVLLAQQEAERRG